MRIAAFNTRRKFLPFIFATGLLFAQCGWLSAQSTTGSSARITKAVDNSVRVKLHGHVPGAAQPQFDRGRADPTAQLQHAQLLLSRSPEQEAALTVLLSQQLDSTSPNYHKWLTPEQLGQQYGPAESDVQKVVGWLQSEGLTVGRVSKARTFVDFSGPVALIEQAFGVSMHSFNTGQVSFLAPVNEPQIPAALAPVVNGIARLSTIPPHPGVQTVGQVKIDPTTHKFVPAGTPATTLGNGVLYVSAADAQTIYDVPNSKYNPNYPSTKPTYDGTGVTIGIGGTNLVNLAPVVSYRQFFVGDSKPPVVVSDFGATKANDTEADLDLELSGGAAPGATIVYYPDPYLFSGVIQAADDNKVDVFSLSYGSCEAWNPQIDNVFFSQMWQQFAAQGISVAVSTGDSGAAGCDYAGVSAATGGLHVSALASTPYNIAVGGTDLFGLTQNGVAAYTTSTNQAYNRTAIGYIPESTWNDSTWPNGDLADNVPLIYDVGGSGGPSNCAFNTTDSSGSLVCQGGWPKPFWQGGPGVPDDQVRDTPDVSLFAGNGVYGAAWIFCTDAGPCSNGYYYAGGGTSAAAPTFAGILADAVQKTGGRLGQAAATLYKLARTPSAKNSFHDVAIGNISMMCASGSSDCAADANGYYYLTGYNTTPDYDLATGLGSVDAANLINNWQDANTGSGKATVSVTPSATTVSASQNLTVTVQVAGNGPAPTGTVTLSTDTYGSSAVKLNPHGANADTVTFTLSSSDLQLLLFDAFGPGQYNLLVTYSGDVNYSPITGSATVTITQ